MKVRSRSVASVIIALGAGLFGTVAGAETWPDKPIRMILPLAAGGTTDVATRVIAAELANELGQSVVVENRAGANGLIGVQFAAKAKPDGYTFVVGSSTTMAANKFLYKNPGIDPLKDFVPVVMLGTLDFVMVVPADSKYGTVQDLIADAKANPQKVTYGSGSSGTLLCSETFLNVADIDLLRVPYQSTPQAVIDLMAGRIDLMCDALGTTMPMVEAGKLRFLAATGKERDEKVSDVPTLLESDIPMTHQTWAGFFAISDTPPEIIERMSTEILKILERPEVQEKVRQQGFMPAQVGTKDFTVIHRDELIKAESLIKQAGIQPE